MHPPEKILAMPMCPYDVCFIRCNSSYQIVCRYTMMLQFCYQSGCVTYFFCLISFTFRKIVTYVYLNRKSADILVTAQWCFFGVP